jgi:hypothetical protein
MTRVIAFAAALALGALGLAGGRGRGPARSR